VLSIDSPAPQATLDAVVDAVGARFLKAVHLA